MARQVSRALVLVVIWTLAVAGPSAASAPAAGTAAPISPKVTAELASKGSATAWVVLKAKADLRPAFGMSWDARGKYVYDALTTTAARSQAGIQHYLAARGIAYQSYWIWNAIRVKATAATLKTLAARTDVASVDAPFSASLQPVTPGSVEATVNSVEWGVANIRADQVWSTYGDRGEGIVVATIDTGVLYTHPALVNQYRGNNHDGSFTHDYNWWDPSFICNPSPTMVAPCDNAGHGTHTMGTIVGDDGGANQIGVAPGAKWMAAKGCESNSCSDTALTSSGQFVVAPTNLAGQSADTSKRPNIVSNSWGGGGNASWYQSTVNAWVAAGIFPVFANGNTGPGCGSAGSPGDYVNTYAVGAYDVTNTIASFSSRGPSAFGGELKPNISAPGVNVRSSYNDGSYTNLSGTSMATPHVAGAVALLWSAAPSLIGNITSTRTLLDQTAVDTSDLTCGGTAADNNVYGEGRLDIKAAVDISPKAPHGTLTGTVSDGSSSPIAGVNVTASSSGTTRTTTTNASGVYTMTLPVGTYTVTGTRFGYQNGSASGVGVADGGTTTQNLTMTQLASFPVSGTVRDGSSNPVAGATVTIQGTPIAPATTNASGQYSFASVPNGSYTVAAVPSTRCLTSGSQPLSVSGGPVSNLDFSLAAKQDTFGYHCQVESTSFVPGTDLQAVTGDDAVQAIALPFPFTFYGTTYSTANIGSNGYLDFADASASFSNTPIPNAGQPNGSIFPYWDDLYLDTPTAQVYTASLGSAPNRQFVIEWRNVRYFSDATRRVGFEIILNENGQIQTMYQGIAPGDGLEMGNSATVGIENAAGTVGLQYSSNEAVLSSGLAVRYVPPGGGGGNQAPIANADSAQTNEDTPVTIAVLANDSDPNGDPLSITNVSDPPHGTASIVSGQVQYVPDANYNGPDSFTYQATDGSLTSSAATVSVTVDAVDDAPTISIVGPDQSAWSCSPTAASGSVAVAVADIDNASLSVTGASSATKVVANAGIVIGPSGATRNVAVSGSGTKGAATVTVTVSDGQLTSSVTFSVRVGGSGKDNLSGGAGTDLLFGLAGNDTLRGNAGSDLLCGGAGNDSLTGGSELDYFSGAGGTDTAGDVIDFGDGTIP